LHVSFFVVPFAPRYHSRADCQSVWFKIAFCISEGLDSLHAKHMKENRYKILLAGLTLACTAIFSRAQETNAARTLIEIQAQLTAHVEQPRFSGALWGVKVVSLASGKTLFEHHADRLMSPASNSKMYPAALALDRLGVAAEQTLFVSSNAWDAHAASAFGMRVVWCNRGNLPRERLPGQPDKEISSLRELPGLFATDGSLFLGSQETQ
jgi:hypothetical protein